MSKEEYVEHLRENGETLAAEIEEKVVVKSDCADANPGEETGICADASGHQPEDCPECGERVMAYVEVVVGETGTVARKTSVHCSHEWTERTVCADT
jgi:hypothetical protein